MKRSKKRTMQRNRMNYKEKDEGDQDMLELLIDKKETVINCKPIINKSLGTIGDELRSKMEDTILPEDNLSIVPSLERAMLLKNNYSYGLPRLEKDSIVTIIEHISAITVRAITEDGRTVTLKKNNITILDSNVKDKQKAEVINIFETKEFADIVQNELDEKKAIKEEPNHGLRTDEEIMFPDDNFIVPERLQGYIKRYYADKGYGFITQENHSSGQDVFFHCSNVNYEIPVSEGNKVDFYVKETLKGPEAFDISVLHMPSVPEGKDRAVISAEELKEIYKETEPIDFLIPENPNIPLARLAKVLPSNSLDKEEEELNKKIHQLELEQKILDIDKQILVMKREQFKLRKEL